MNLDVAVFDSSPLIIFHQVGRFELLRSLFSHILVPPAVAREVAPSLGQLPEWIDVRLLEKSQMVPGALDDGERAAITLALNTAVDFIALDDLPARRVAAKYGLTVVGSLGLLVRAKDHGLIDVVRPMMNEMIAFGLFFHSGALYGNPACGERVLMKSVPEHAVADVKKVTCGREPRKVIYVPGRLISIVI